MIAATTAGSIAVLAPAKVNLYLHVLGRRPDGYHILDSLVVFAGCGDRIEVAAADRLRLTVDGPFASDVPTGNDNLVRRAARALANEVGRAATAAIRLTKSLPVASGIGGGSSDAAATLRALLRLWRIDIDGARLRRLALALGADVPMCLDIRPSFVGGIGERIEAAPDLPSCALVLINPRVALPTAQVFARRAGPFSQAARFNGAWPADARALVALLAERRNDLTAAAMAIAPEVASVLDALASTPGVLLARMSGSGATCYGLCETEAMAAAAASTLAARYPQWWIEAAAVAAALVND
jgi:4-diphosphocytidyl-2-C-methyl-D-erythritol kinase